MRSYGLKIILAVLFIAWFGVLLPGHESPWLSALDIDGADPTEALAPVEPAVESKADRAPVPHHHEHDAGKCHLCQLAARMTHAGPPPLTLAGLLPLNHLYVVAPKAYVCLDVRLTSDSRGPPAAV